MRGVIVLIIVFMVLGAVVYFDPGDVLSIDRTDSNQDYLAVARAHPERHLIVVGEDFFDYEMELAEELADVYGLKIKTAPEVSKQNGLILIGTSATNILLDKYVGDDKKGISGYGNLVLWVENSNKAADYSNLLVTEQINFDFGISSLAIMVVW